MRKDFLVIVFLASLLWQVKVIHLSLAGSVFLVEVKKRSEL